MQCDGGKENNPTAPPPKPMNIIVILDTSNRIDERRHPGQAEKDIMIAQTIVNYNHELARKIIFGTYNHVAFVVPNQPNTTKVPLQITQKLKIWPTWKDLNVGAKKLDPMKEDLLSGIKELYDFVGKQERFTGSNIWRWFQRSGEAYLKKDERNYIICVSDGYLDFDKTI